VCVGCAARLDQAPGCEGNARWGEKNTNASCDSDVMVFSVQLKCAVLSGRARALLSTLPDW